MKSITAVTFIVILGISACGDAEKAAENKTENTTENMTEKKEHIFSTQQRALEQAKAVKGIANEATEKRQKELDKLK